MEVILFIILAFGILLCLPAALRATLKRPRTPRLYFHSRGKQSAHPLRFLPFCNLAILKHERAFKLHASLPFASLRPIQGEGGGTHSHSTLRFGAASDAETSPFRLFFLCRGSFVSVSLNIRTTTFSLRLLAKAPRRSHPSQGSELLTLCSPCLSFTRRDCH